MVQEHFNKTRISLINIKIGGDTMAKKHINKADIVLALLEIEEELERLERSLQTSLNEFKNEWLTEHEVQLEQCHERLNAIEQSQQISCYKKKVLIS